MARFISNIRDFSSSRGYNIYPLPHFAFNFDTNNDTNNDINNDTNNDINNDTNNDITNDTNNDINNDSYSNISISNVTNGVLPSYPTRFILFL